AANFARRGSGARPRICSLSTCQTQSTFHNQKAALEGMCMSSPVTKSNVEVQKSGKFGNSGGVRFKANELLLFVVVVALLLIGVVINPRFLGIDNVKVMSRDAAILG